MHNAMTDTFFRHLFTINFFENFDITFPLIGLGSYPAHGSWVEAVGTAPPHAFQQWLFMNWAAYNAANGETRPVMCDLDGDGLDEVVIGLGAYPANGGWLQVRDDITKGYAHLRWINIDWATYSAVNGETFPACGDVDGDRLDEIIVGLGDGGQGWLKGFDDALTDYAALPGTNGNSGWIRLGWGAYNAASGATHPAIGQLDTDSAEELVVGLGSGGQGWVQILDDASTDFTPLAGTPVNNGWVQLDWAAYNAAHGETRPAVCDLDHDGSGEIVLGLGSGGDGWLQTLDSATGFTAFTDAPSANGWVRVNWVAYNTSNGETFPACGNVDADPADELLIGLGQGADGFVEIKDDAATRLTHRSWPKVHWNAYNAANGSTHPAVGR